MTKQHKNLIDFTEKSFSEKLAIIEERNKTYGSNFDVQGNVMSAIFPNGLELKTESDWKRIGVFMNIIGKITRYANTFSEGGHKDSLVDTCNYCTILEFLDKNCEVERDIEEVIEKQFTKERVTHEIGGRQCWFDENGDIRVDKNGCTIYEGSIVKFDDPDIKETWEVQYISKDGRINGGGSNPKAKDCEIISSIYKKSEFLLDNNKKEK
jgi:hypothetical protein